MGGVTHWIFTIAGSRDEGGAWYGLWSGFGGALPDVLILSALIGWLYHNNCHQHRCWRLGRHAVGATGVRVCRRHHPELARHHRLTGDKIASLGGEQHAASLDDVVTRLDSVIGLLGGRKRTR